MINLSYHKNSISKNQFNFNLEIFINYKENFIILKYYCDNLLPMEHYMVFVRRKYSK